MNTAKPHATFYDIQANSQAALREWNVGVGTGEQFRFDDAEVKAALNVANDGLIALADAVRRAQARYAIEIARGQIEWAERVLAEVTPE